jgi:hypothetical protein
LTHLQHTQLNLSNLLMVSGVTPHSLLDQEVVTSCDKLCQVVWTIHLHFSALQHKEKRMNI